MDLEDFGLTPDIPDMYGNEDETSFNAQPIEGAWGGDEQSINDPVTSANAALKEANLPDLDTIIKNKATDGSVSSEFRDRLAKAITKEKPKTEEDIEKAIQSATKQALPAPPSSTPGVDQHTQNKIGVVLSRLDLYTIPDHSKFTMLDNDGLEVQTSKGKARLTQLSDPRLFLRTPTPDIPANEYRALFGISKEEYTRRIGKNNQEVVRPADDDLETDQSQLSNSKDWVSSVKDVARTLVDKLRGDRKKAEFNYRRVAEETEMTEMDKQEGRLPERELVAIDQRFQTLEGQIQIASSKAVEVREKIKVLDGKADKTPEDISQLQRLHDELDGHNEILKVLKGMYGDEVAKMRKQRNIILGIAGVTSVGGILATIFEAVANALGSDTVKELIPKSTDPKDIVESGLGKIIKKKLQELATYFHDRYLNSTGAVQAFWRMMENAVSFLEDHLWLVIAATLATLLYKLNKK